MTRFDQIRSLGRGLVARLAGDLRVAPAPISSRHRSGKPKVLYVNHSPSACGVFEFGKNVGKALSTSEKFDVLYEECESERDLNARIRRDNPVAIIYNYHPTTMDWARWNAPFINVPQLATIHEVYQKAADEAHDYAFDYHVAPDPTLLLKNPIVFKTGRLIPEYQNAFPLPGVPTFGSFGFGTAGKNFDKIVTLVQEEFDSAIIRLQIPFATFGDADGARAKAIAEQCRRAMTRPGITLEIRHEYLDERSLLDFLATNSLNVFLYEQSSTRAVSSVIDYALAVDRPIGVSESTMFRHVHAAAPSAIIPRQSLRQILAGGAGALRPLKAEYTRSNLVWEYERILVEILRRGRRRHTAGKLTGLALSRLPVGLRRRRYRSWATADETEYPMMVPAAPSGLTEVSPELVPGYNRILDDSARALYNPVIEQLWTLAPAMMRKKIPEANVQQAFVLDTAVKMARNYSSPTILAVGSYQDTAVAGLKALRYNVVETDPVLNYDVHTFLTKPGVIGRQFEIVVSTSVIEHVADDEEFCRDIARALRPGGMAILTCDYNDQYKPGDSIPSVDYRLYTQNDLKNRLLKAVPELQLYDQPQWDCPAPDFVLADRYRYTFATIVLKKGA